MSATSKPIVLVFVGQYLPGFKAGGILRSMENMVNHLRGQFQFMIVTRDRDLGDDIPYPNIKYHAWQEVGNARVYYLAPGAESVSQVRRIAQETPHDLIYLNSFFEPLTIKVLFNIKLGRIDRKPILLAPRGEFARASLCLKYPKKALFMRLARTMGLYAPVTWHASSTFEAEDIMNVMNIRRESIHIALDLPTIAEGGTDDAPCHMPAWGGDGLRVVFLSRISPEKRLDFALKVLSRVGSKVTFDIIGPIENTAYWSECQKLFNDLPPHVTVRSLGSIKPLEVLRTLGQYDLLLFPSGGESYGHVIAESLTTGTPVLISMNTPWRDLEAKGLGWDLPLENPDRFVRVIDELASASDADRLQRRNMIKETMRQILTDPSAVQGNQRLFDAALACEIIAGAAATR